MRLAVCWNWEVLSSYQTMLLFQWGRQIMWSFLMAPKNHLLSFGSWEHSHPPLFSEGLSSNIEHLLVQTIHPLYLGFVHVSLQNCEWVKTANPYPSKQVSKRIFCKGVVWFCQSKGLHTPHCTDNISPLMSLLPGLKNSKMPCMTQIFWYFLEQPHQGWVWFC